MPTPIEAAAGSRLPGVILGALMGGGLGLATAGEEEDALIKGIMYSLGGAAAGYAIPQLNEAGTIIKEELAKGLAR